MENPPEPLKWQGMEGQIIYIYILQEMGIGKESG